MKRIKKRIDRADVLITRVSAEKLLNYGAFRRQNHRSESRSIATVVRNRPVLWKTWDRRDTACVLLHTLWDSLHLLTARQQNDGFEPRPPKQNKTSLFTFILQKH